MTWLKKASTNSSPRRMCIPRSLQLPKQVKSRRFLTCDCPIYGCAALDTAQALPGCGRNAYGRRQLHSHQNGTLSGTTSARNPQEDQCIGAFANSRHGPRRPRYGRQKRDFPWIVNYPAMAIVRSRRIGGVQRKLLFNNLHTPSHTEPLLPLADSHYIPTLRTARLGCGGLRRVWTFGTRRFYPANSPLQDARGGPLGVGKSG